MSNLQHRQSIIQEKRKKTPWRDFVMEICSWFSVMFYKNNGLISTYPVSSRSNVVSISEYLTQDTKEMEYGSNFFTELQKLFIANPVSNVNHWGENENSDFADTAVNVKDAYLSFTVTKGSQSVLYSIMVRESKDVYNSIYVVDGSQLVYYSKCIIGSSLVFYSKYITNSNNIWFSTNCLGCTECICCNNLENVSYCINNMSYEKEEYLIIKNRLLSDQSNFEAYIQKTQVKGVNYGSKNCSGSFIIDSEDIENGEMIFGAKVARNVVMTGSIDGGSNRNDFIIGGAGCFDVYACANSGNFSQQLYCSWGIGRSTSCFYSYKLESCSFCLGCIGLKNKSYCILNKQYTKEERYSKVDEIFGAMHADGVLGDFFPASMNPFYFNDTAAYLIGSSPAGTTTKGGGQTFTKEEVTAKGYLRRDEPIKVDIPAGVQTVSVKDLDKYEGWKPRSVIARNGAERNDEAISNTDSHASLAMTQGNQIASSPSQDSKAPRNDVDSGGQQWYIDDEILKKVIIDEQGNAYRIIPMELEFLRKYELPLPRKHWLDRMKENFRIS